MNVEVDNSEGSWSELLTRQYFSATITLSLGVVLFAFNVFFVATAMPSAIMELGGEEYLSWTFALYLVFAIASGAAANLLQVKFGTRLVFLTAAGIFAAGTIMSASATSIEMVLAGRALQGLGAGPIEALSYALIPVLFPSRLVPKVFGVEAVGWAAAAFGGPALAGYLTQELSWRAAFLISLPLAAIFVILVLFVVPRNRTDATNSVFPGLRIALLISGILAICIAGISSLAPALILLAVAITLLYLFLRVDRQNRVPLLPRSAFTFSSTIGFGFWTIVLMAIAESAAAVFLVYSVQNVFQFTALAAGIIGATLAISWSFSQILISSFASEKTRHALIWIGASVLIAAFLTLTAGFYFRNIALVVLSQLMIGMSFGANWGNMSQYLMEAATDEERAATATLLPTSQMAGFAIGDAVVGLIGNQVGFATAQTPDAIREVVLIVFLCGAILAIPGAITAYKTVNR
jgi:MFS family permease